MSDNKYTELHYEHTDKVNLNRLNLDYTTPEQSKRLIELGIPIESANIVYYHTPDSWHDPYLITEKKQIENLKSGKGLPCWSAGRLIEILEIILGSPWGDKQLLGEQGTLLERVLSDFEDIVKYKEIFNDNRIDFSKLKE